MNSGNKVRGQADGFHIEILPKLRDVKTSDNTSNLLHYLTAYYVGHVEKVCGNHMTCTVYLPNHMTCTVYPPNHMTCTVYPPNHMTCTRVRVHLLDILLPPQAQYTEIFPLPDPSDLMSASQMDFELLNEEVDVLSQQFKAVKGRIKIVLKASSRETVEPFKTKMENFSAQSKYVLK